MRVDATGITGPDARAYALRKADPSKPDKVRDVRARRNLRRRAEVPAGMAVHSRHLAQTQLRHGLYPR